MIKTIPGFLILGVLGTLTVFLSGCVCTSCVAPGDEQMMKAEPVAEQPEAVAKSSAKPTDFEVRGSKLFSRTASGVMTAERDRSRFSFDNAVLSRADHTYLRTHASYLRRNSTQRITVEGHCDERGTREYNLALGDLRAKAVSDYLRTQGVSKTQIKVVSWGEEKPLDPGKRESAWSKNRRAVIIYQ